MKLHSGAIRLSASDLSNHLACNHLSSLDLEVATGFRPIPDWNSPDAWVLQQRGIEHEAAYVRHLLSQSFTALSLQDIRDEKKALAETVAAMQKGVDIIIQAALADGSWFGRADVLRRVELESDLGIWSYEAYDCKLALETKAAALLQLSLYSELLASVQGRWPIFMHVVPPNEGFKPDTHRLSDYSAYYRYVKHRLLGAAAGQQPGLTYPEPTEHCGVCRWWGECNSQRRSDDHLSLVAGISRLQRKQLVAWDITTVQNLSVLRLPLQQRPERGSRKSYVRVREQARIQVAGRTEKRPVVEVLDLNEEHGFNTLPVPSAGDVFFDLEGDPFVERGGREYLFGFAARNAEDEVSYDCRWGITPHEEKQAFEWFVDSIMARWAAHPGMHIYHFTGYEPGALKRLMGRYATREDELDRMLRAHLFVDLHSIVKRTVRASVEEYSLKSLEEFHNFERKMALTDARQAMRHIQHSLELNQLKDITDSARECVAIYNADDCFSTSSLRDWLEDMRSVAERAGDTLRRPELSDGAPSERVDDRQKKSAALAARLRDGVAEDPLERSEEQRVRWLLSNLLDWHRREIKAEVAEYYRLGEMTNEELLDEKSALSGLVFVERIGMEAEIPTDRYQYEKQETDIRAGKELHCKGSHIGKAVGINIAGRTVDIKKMKKTAEIHPDAVYVKSATPGTEALADSLYRLANWVEVNGADADGPYRAARDVLLCRPPRLNGGATELVVKGEKPNEAAVRIGGLLENSFLAIQGPPGAGKTYTGAHMICRLIAQGKRIGILGTSHKVIGKLLEDTLKAAEEDGITRRCKCVQKVKKEDKPEKDTDQVRFTTGNPDTFAAFTAGANVLAGTQWVFAREEYFQALDVLFVDEAGQMSLANVLAASQAARNVVLLGDPQQLEQPLKGSHPEGADLSALEHVLCGHKTMPHDKGLFLPKTWRMHPKLCAFTSEVFYEGLLTSRDGLENQKIEGHPWLGEAGLWFVPVVHEGNQNSSPEEVERIAGIIDTLIQPDVNWTDDDGKSQPMRLEDILIVAPYNAQVGDMAARLPPGARIGTVDKFQGQEAPVVIYSLTTSSPEDAPRGMEFLYSLNRLNVATSRAKAMVIVACSPRLLQPDCRTPRHMQLANALCRYVELAQSTGLAAGARG